MLPLLLLLLLPANAKAEMTRQGEQGGEDRLALQSFGEVIT